jgi:hypothetical protein
MERKISISNVRLGKDLHIARELLSHFNITER